MSLTVGVVILSHRPAFLPEALASVFAQTHPPDQVIVQYSLRMWPTKLNDAANALRTDALVFLCDDDLLEPTLIERCAQQIVAGADTVHTDRRIFTDGCLPSTGVVFPCHGPAYQGEPVFWVQLDPRTMQFGTSLPLTCMIRRTWWDRMGGFDPDMPHAETEFWYRTTVARGRMAYVPEPLFLYRQHPGQESSLHDATVMAQQVFHRKHFMAFGVLPHTIVPDGYQQVTARILDPSARLAYATAHFTAYTNAGYMATDTYILPETMKTAIRLAQAKAQQEVQDVIDQALADCSLSFAEGWRVDDHLNAVKMPVTIQVNAPDKELRLMPNEPPQEATA